MVKHDKGGTRTLIFHYAT